jgi:hypothetical protein
VNIVIIQNCLALPPFPLIIFGLSLLVAVMTQITSHWLAVAATKYAKTSPVESTQQLGQRFLSLTHAEINGWSILFGQPMV